MLHLLAQLGDFAADYDPTNSNISEGEVQQNRHFRAIDSKRKKDQDASAIGLESIHATNPAVYANITRADRFKSMIDFSQNLRLKQALIDRFKNRNN